MMTLYYRLEPDNEIGHLGDIGVEDAKEHAKAALRMASRKPGKREPEAVILYDDGIELFRWTQRDRRRDETPGPVAG